MKKPYVDVSVEDLLGWFHDNYEDAVHGVFYDGSDGGYQYLPGAGPCEPLEVLQEEFPDAEPEILQEAADILLSEGSAWIKKEIYPSI